MNEKERMKDANMLAKDNQKDKKEKKTIRCLVQKDVLGNTGE